MATSVVQARLAATVSLLALCIGAPALAQTTPDAGATAVDDIIVTAQKREQSIQDVPIAVSAFSAEALDAMKIEGGSELLRAIPNVAFSKNNFSMYNFAIRGIGTKAVSSSSDPAVAVSFNNAPLIRNRLFEQEYLDVSRVEVLRGPQGTLYGRNATAGVVNMIPNLPGPDFEALLKGEVGNYGSMRGQMMVNLPIAETFWVRGAASLTKRDGFDHNTFRDTKINNRDLWSTRFSAAWEPNDRFNSSFIWEHFNEDDQRSRTGKQLCANDPGPEQIGATKVATELARARLSQGCLAKSLYDDASYGTPNGAAMAYIFPLTNIIVGYRNRVAQNAVIDLLNNPNPYKGVVQSRDLREVSTYFDPKYQAENDVFQLNFSYELSDNITVTSQTLYTKDRFKASQDYNRFVSNNIFRNADFNGLTNLSGRERYPDFKGIVAGEYTDPQLGTSGRVLSLDLSKSNNKQFYQEFRVQSSNDGPFNFILGANYTDFDTKDDYYVFNNIFTFLSEYFYGSVSGLAASGVVDCAPPYNRECVYVDRSSLADLVGDGHNYFRSKNEVSTTSWGLYGEAYWEFDNGVGLTAGLRYTDDSKTSTPYPSQLLLGAVPNSTSGLTTGGYTHRGYPALPPINQGWESVTGRAVIDWKPNDETMMYASYARGYKGGGSNPPRADINPNVIQYQPLPELFEPEYLNSFEVGYKTSFLNGAIRFNSTAFYYDYKDYQVSQIVDRISLNENFDATNYGAEFEFVYNVTPNFRVDANLGLLKTKIADGESSIDVMNRTQGNPDWTLVRPWLQVPSNCVAPTKHVEAILKSPYYNDYGILALTALCSGTTRYGTFTPELVGALPLNQLFGFTYNPLKDAPNGGRGFEADLSGNELPNAPRFTANIGAQYTYQISEWDLTIRGDYYRQAESYFRVYNTDYDRLKGWDNLNLSISIESRNRNLSIQGYVKNVFDNAPIVDAYTNSDDSLLTTNVFTLDPRVYGLSVTSRF